MKGLWVMLGLLAATPADAAPQHDRSKESTSFQTSRAWDPKLDIQADVAMVYGIDKGLPDRLKSWTERGYVPHVMTGVSWGEYQDYLYGRFDGINHEDAAQQEENGTKISHGGDVYYMVPEEPFGRFLCVGVKRAIDAGAQAVYLEEPEFWARGGWSPAFKREWKAYYNEDWQAPNSSPAACYKAAKLKYFLYKRALGQVFAFIKDYSKQIGRPVKAYVPTHSMINYAHWAIVSPESSLATLPGCDGFIAQTWTGTARTPNRYNGVIKERTFETAFFEYGQMHNLARATGSRMIFLADPVEDDPNHSWADYKVNYEQTLVASLLWPDVSHFEVTPWPERPFSFSYPTKDSTERKPGEKVDRVPIPAPYATQLMTCFEALKNMDQADVEFHASATGVGVLVSDTLMFHRGGPDDPSGDLSQFYGQAMPLLKRGVAVHPVQLENLGLKDYLKPYKVLVLSYVGQKPMSSVPHDALVKWVKAGGALVWLGSPDPFAATPEWWNENGKTTSTPEDDLFSRLGLPAKPGDSTTKVGKGIVIRSSLDPRHVADKGGAWLKRYLELTGKAFAHARLPNEPGNAIWLRRGPYVTGAVLEETGNDRPLTLKGTFIDLFSPELKVIKDPEYKPGQRFLLVRSDKIERGPRVVAGSAAVRGWTLGTDSVSFQAYGPKDVEAVLRVRLMTRPTNVTIGGQPATAGWDAATKTALVRFMNQPDGLDVRLAW